MTSDDTNAAARQGRAPARVVIAVNPVGEYALVIDAAARLAARLEAQLEAILVEDPGLLEIARIPSSQVIDRSGRNRILDDRTVHRAWRLQRRRLDETLRRCTGALKVRSSMRIVQGRFVAEALSMAAQVDVTVLAQSSSLVSELSIAQRGWPHAHAGARHEPATVRRPRPVWVLFDASVAAERALALGAQLALDYHSDLLVLLPGGEAGIDDALRERVRVLIGAGPPRVTLVPMTGTPAQALTALRRPEGCALVLAPRDALDAHSASDILEAFAQRAYPLILVA